MNFSWKNLHPFKIFLIVVILSLSILTLHASTTSISLNTLSYGHDADQVKVNKGYIKGKFIAQENYLGIVSVRFGDLGGSSGNVTFRIRNTLDGDWYHISTTSAHQLNTFPLYAFGLPAIRSSRGNAYEFEIIAQERTGYLSLATKEPIFVTQYVYPRREILKSTTSILGFLLHKITFLKSFLTFWHLVLSLAISVLVFTTYIFLRMNSLWRRFSSYINSQIMLMSYPSAVFVFAGILFDIFLSQAYSDQTIKIYSILWLTIMMIYRLENRFSYGIAIILLALCPFFVSKTAYSGEKLAIWGYTFLIIGTVQLTLEMVSKKFSILRKIQQMAIGLLFLVIYIDSTIIRIFKKGLHVLKTKR